MSTVEAPAATPVLTDELGTELVGQARERARVRLAGSERRTLGLLATAFVAAAACLVVFLPPVRGFSPLAAVVALVSYVAVSRIRFEVGNFFVVPSELVLVPMLFVLPPRAVPLVVAAALTISKGWEVARGELAINKLPIALVDASHSLGPALVLGLAAPGPPSWRNAPVYVGALAAQFAADLVPMSVWSWALWDISLVELARSVRVAMLVDAALAPVGLAFAIATVGRPWGLLVVLPLVGLLNVFSRDRQVRIDHALELSSAYRGTAMLLGDVIEADDEYTGSHSRDVVDLVMAVADRLALDPRERQHAELAALLHDVGKVKIPSEIINKPGPLTEDERALMNTHTIVGEAMLDQVGGLLGEVGRIVRSCHERWDGAGYPDELSGEQIPLAARIVCACDAWSAMTTDRSYRKARSVAEAAQELRRCAGTHFDPRVVEALLAVLGV